MLVTRMSLLAVCVCPPILQQERVSGWTFEICWQPTQIREKDVGGAVTECADTVAENAQQVVSHESSLLCLSLDWGGARKFQ